MKRHSLKRSSTLYFAILMMGVSASCSPTTTAQSIPTVVQTSTPEPLSLINGQLNACLLISPAEVESVLGIKVVTELRFAMIGATSCKYTSVSDGQTIFSIYVFTDATLKKVHEASSAVETYENMKMGDLNFQKMIPEIKVEDIDNFGDQAYFREGKPLVVINVLNHEIYYQFVATTVDAGGMGYEGLMKLAQIALQRMPVNDLSKELSCSEEGFLGRT